MTEQIERVRVQFHKVAAHLPEIDPTAYTLTEANNNIRLARFALPVFNFSVLWTGQQSDERLSSLIVWYLSRYTHTPPPQPTVEASDEDKESLAEVIRRVTRELS